MSDDLSQINAHFSLLRFPLKVKMNLKVDEKREIDSLTLSKILESTFWVLISRRFVLFSLSKDVNKEREGFADLISLSKIYSISVF